MLYHPKQLERDTISVPTITVSVSQRCQSQWLENNTLSTLVLGYYQNTVEDSSAKITNKTVSVKGELMVFTSSMYSYNALCQCVCVCFTLYVYAGVITFTEYFIYLGI